MTSTFLRTSEPTTPARNTDRNRFLHTLVFLLGFLAAMIAAEPASAQYSCFPTCSDVDARFLSISGTNLSTLINSDVIMKIGSPGIATTVEIGIFDGETGGRWDFGTTPLLYTLYADPTGQGIGTTQVASWTASQMLDNQWTTFTVNNVAAARAANGNYLYNLVIATTDPLAHYWSNFKVRTTGTVALRAQAFTVSAVAVTSADLDVIYPAGWSNVTPSTPTTYDGTFSFFLDVLTKETTLSIWDGDMDHGSFDCSVNDVDDINTSNFVIPPWSNPLSANLEGVGYGDPCAFGGGLSTGTPPDDIGNAKFRRSPAITYDVITPDPDGKTFTNDNPSGNKEWELFRIATGPIDNIANDAHIDSLPTGVYEVRTNGMDISNLNGWRFFSDVLGIDAVGKPVPPLRPFTINGVVCLTAATAAAADSDDDDDNGSKNKNKSKNKSSSSTNDPAPSSSTCGTTLEDVEVVLVGDLNGDGVNDVVRTTTTDSEGRYSFPELEAGSYRVNIVTSTLPSGAVADSDYDGVATPNTAAVVIASGSANPGSVYFRYRLGGDGTGTGTNGVRTQGYWKNHANNWPVTSISIGCTTYTRTNAIKIMKTSVSGDKTYSMFYQLVAAKLNVAAGARSSCIATVIGAAENWMCSNKLGSNVSASSTAWTNSGSALHSALDDYNNGKSCAPHVD